jgi:hypothetical protein
MKEGMSTPFENRQQIYYTREINRGLPSQGGPAPGDIAAAVSTDHAGLGASAASFLADFGQSTQAVRQADSLCRSLPYPSPAMRDPSARSGCGWWFVPDTQRQSTGAFGTRRGPMDPTLDTSRGPGQWIWDPLEADAAESLKRASTLKSCLDTVNTGDSRFAWCRATNAAVPVDPATGAVRFSAADCTGQLVYVSDGTAACSTVQPVPGTNAASAAASSSSAVCAGGPPLSPACLLSRATQYGMCSSNGTLATALQGSTYATADDTFNRMNAIMSRQFTLNESTYATGAATVDQIDADVRRLRDFANGTNTGRATSAAMAMCYGTPFDFCNYTTSDTGNFDRECIRSVATNTYGYSANAGLLALDDTYWNPTPPRFATWGDVLANLQWWKTTADNQPVLLPGASTDDIQAAYSLQRQAMWNVYGISMPVVNITCPVATSS